MTERRSRDRLCEDIRAVADTLGKTPTEREFREHGPHDPGLYRRAFGSWNNALEAAGLEPNLIHDIPPKAVLDDIEHVAEEVDRTPTIADMEQFGEYSRSTYQTKFGSYVAALEAAGLEPTRKQYSAVSPEHTEQIPAPINIQFLQKQGPTRGSELPQSPGIQDKEAGLARFSVPIGKRRSSGEPVFYLFDEHKPEPVIREFLDANPDALDRPRNAIARDVGNYGAEWAKAIQRILDEIHDTKPRT